MNIQQRIPNDELTQRIVERLGERQQKIQCMQEWERPAKVVSLPRTLAVLSAVACVTMIFIIAPWQRTSLVDELGVSPHLTEFRSGYPQLAEVQRLLETSEFEAALVLTQQLLTQLDEEINKDFVDVEDEMEVYERTVMCTVNAELRWTYIYLLVKMEQYEEARLQLDSYINDVEYVHHREEAAILREEIEKKMKK